MDPEHVLPDGGMFRIVKLRRTTGYHNPIGAIRKLDDVWEWATLPDNAWRPASCAAVAILSVVRNWRVWVGLPPGQLDY